jgi:hypothetical protein
VDEVRGGFRGEEGVEEVGEQVGGFLETNLMTRLKR